MLQKQILFFSVTAICKFMPSICQYVVWWTDIKWLRALFLLADIRSDPLWSTSPTTFSNVRVHVRAIWKITRWQLQTGPNWKVSSLNSGPQMLTNLWNAEHHEVWINIWYHQSLQTSAQMCKIPVLFCFCFYKIIIWLVLLLLLQLLLLIIISLLLNKMVLDDFAAFFDILFLSPTCFCVKIILKIIWSQWDRQKTTFSPPLF